MTGISCRLSLLLFVLLVSCLIQSSFAQVTFSKGWGPGKRAALHESECRINVKSLVMMFHTLMAEMRHLTACDRQAVVNFLQNVDRH